MTKKDNGNVNHDEYPVGKRQGRYIGQPVGKLAAAGLLLWLTILVITGSATPVTAVVPTWSISHYTTGDSSELVTSIPVTTAATSEYRVIFCLDIGTAPVGGEILAVDADMQVTNNLGELVSFGTQVYLGDSCSALGGTEICEAQGANATVQEHHAVATRSGSITVAAGNSRHHVIMLAWSKSTTAQPGWTISVDQDYGRLAVVRFTPN